MNYTPYSSDNMDLIAESDHRTGVRLMMVMSADDFTKTGYPVIVEMWDKCVGRHSGGRRRRAWLTEFSEAERRKAGTLHRKFHRWYLRTGVPRRVVMSVDTYHLTIRLCNFFGTI